MFKPFLLFCKHFFHCPCRVKLLLSLQKITTISPEQSFSLWNDYNGIRSGESTDEFNSFIVLAEILTLVFISMREDVDCPSSSRHKLPYLAEYLSHIQIIQKYFKSRNKSWQNCIKGLSKKIWIKQGSELQSFKVKLNYIFHKFIIKCSFSS